MLTEDQRAVIAWLASPATHGGVSVARIDTHTAIVFLAGTRAWKLKRAVLYDYVDFSTVDRRRAMCEAEVRLNRRTAPTIYRGVVPVTREGDGSLALGGCGPAVEWLVEMNRFDQQALFDQMCARGELGRPLMDGLAVAVARLHAEAAHRQDHGGRAGMTWVVDGNAAGLAEFGARFLDLAACDRLTRATRLEVERRGALLDTRRDGGYVRQCHGDLHLRNIVLLAGEPTLFDAVEFNDELACTDVFYDLAFLLMDLWRRGLRGHANTVLNRYLAETGDMDGLGLLPLFLSCRAAIRAKTSATAATLQSDARRVGELQATSREYLTLADTLLHPPSPVLVAIGGFSGTGKSTLARNIAPDLGAVPGAVVLRSDEIRKEVCGVPRLERLGPDGYTSEVSARVYATLAERAGRVLCAGHSALVDAVYARPDDREMIARIAAKASVPFAGLWLEAPDSVLIGRVRQRRDDASDADAAVVRGQLGEPTGPITWHRIDASGPPDAVCQLVLSCLSLALPSAA